MQYAYILNYVVDVARERTAQRNIDSVRSRIGVWVAPWYLHARELFSFNPDESRIINRRKTKRN